LRDVPADDTRGAAGSWPFHTTGLTLTTPLLPQLPLF
jgi:hypothetical protein